MKAIVTLAKTLHCSEAGQRRRLRRVKLDPELHIKFDQMRKLKKKKKKEDDEEEPCLKGQVA